LVSLGYPGNHPAAAFEAIPAVALRNIFVSPPVPGTELSVITLELQRALFYLPSWVAPPI